MSVPYLFLLAVLVVGWFPSSARGQDITTGLVGHWKLDEGSGTSAADSSGNGNTGTLTNGPTWTTGQISGAVEFDNLNDYVSASDSASLRVDPITLSAWVNPATLQNNDVIISKPRGNGSAWDDYWIALRGTGEIEFCMEQVAEQDCVLTTDSAVSTDTWTHIVAVWDGTTMLVYKNGAVSSDTGSHTNAPVYGTSAVYIGAENENGTIASFFNGFIDDVRVYDRALTAADVAALYAYTGGCPNPTGATGKIVYNADYNVAQYCNGTSWKAMGPFPGAGGAGCSNPARATGSLLYNADFNVMQYCDGTSWKAMGPVPGAGGAGCSNPAGSTGSMVFNADAAVIQYCDGANWVRIGS